MSCIAGISANELFCLTVPSPNCVRSLFRLNDVTFGGRVGVSQKVTKSDGGEGYSLLSKPYVTSFMDGP